MVAGHGGPGDRPAVRVVRVIGATSADASTARGYYGWCPCPLPSCGSFRMGGVVWWCGTINPRPGRGNTLRGGCGGWRPRLCAEGVPPGPPLSSRDLVGSWCHLRELLYREALALPMTARWGRPRTGGPSGTAKHGVVGVEPLDPLDALPVGRWGGRARPPPPGRGSASCVGCRPRLYAEGVPPGSTSFRWVVVPPSGVII